MTEELIELGKLGHDVNVQHHAVATTSEASKNGLNNGIPIRTKDDTSFADSAYVSTAQLNEAPTVEDSKEGQRHARQRGRLIPGTCLFMFKKEGNAGTIKHYDNMALAIDELLAQHITATARDSFCSWGLRVAIVGKTEEEAMLQLLVFCAPQMEDIIRSFFQSPRITDLLNSDQPYIPPLPVFIVPKEPKRASTYLDVDVCTDHTFTSTHKTYCGAPIMLRNGKSGKNQVRRATFGGMVKVTDGHGDIQLYGVTAGHAVEDLLKPRIALEPPKNQASGCHGFPCDVGDWICEHQILGRVCNPNSFPAVSANRAVPTHDWALFGVHTPRPNMATIPNDALEDVPMSKDEQTHQILGVKHPHFPDDISDPVLLLSGIRGTQRGELSSLPARIWIAQTKGFVKAYMLELDEGAAVCEGDSGAWVVHHAAPELYGHVVATDALGDAYVIPALDTLDDIRKCLGAVSVTLPTQKDIVAEGLDTSMAKNHTSSQSRGSFLSDIETPKPISAKASQRSLPRQQISRENGSIPQNSRDLQWISLFHNSRTSHDNISRLDSRRAIGGDGDTLDLLLRDYEDTVPSCELEEIKYFCNGVSSQHLLSGISQANTRRGAWVDIRSFRSYQNATSPSWLTATELYQTLRPERLNEIDQSGAGRRLIYVTDLDPYYILALAETIPDLYIKSLCNCIWKHLALQTSLLVKIPIRGFVWFHLDFQLAYFKLRNNRQAERHASTRENKTFRKCVDISFLDLVSHQHNIPLDGIYEAHFSLMIAGTEDTRWTAYAFDDAREAEESTCDFYDSASDDVDDEFHIDPIISINEELDANAPILDPRKYFLWVVHMRMCQALKEWTYLVRKIEGAVNVHKEIHVARYRGRSYPTEDFESTFNWIILTIDLLRMLRSACSRTTRSLERFCSTEGDISHFTQSSKDTSCRGVSTNSIRDNLSSMTEVELRIMSILEHCEGLYQVLELRMSFQRDRINQHQYHESQRLRLETNRYALENHKTARLTSRTTVMAYTTYQLVAPIAIVLAYFSTTNAIFGFERNLKSFIISIIILTITLRIFIIVIILVQQSAWKQCYSWLGEIQSDRVVSRSKHTNSEC